MLLPAGTATKAKHRRLLPMIRLVQLPKISAYLVEAFWAQRSAFFQSSDLPVAE